MDPVSSPRTTTSRTAAPAPGRGSGSSPAGRGSAVTGPGPGPAPSVPRWVWIGVAVAGAVALVVAASATGITAFRELSDPGAFTRWGLPFAKLVHNLAMPLTLAALIFAVGILPHHAAGPRGARRHPRGTRASGAPGGGADVGTCPLPPARGGNPRRPRQGWPVG